MLVSAHIWGTTSIHAPAWKTPAFGVQTASFMTNVTNFPAKTVENVAILQVIITVKMTMYVYVKRTMRAKIAKCWICAKLKIIVAEVRVPPRVTIKRPVSVNSATTETDASIMMFAKFETPAKTEVLVKRQLTMGTNVPATMDTQVLIVTNLTLVKTTLVAMMEFVFWWTTDLVYTNANVGTGFQQVIDASLQTRAWIQNSAQWILYVSTPRQSILCADHWIHRRFLLELRVPRTRHVWMAENAATKASVNVFPPLKVIDARISILVGTPWHALIKEGVNDYLPQMQRWKLKIVYMLFLCLERKTKLGIFSTTHFV